MGEPKIAAREILNRSNVQECRRAETSCELDPYLKHSHLVQLGRVAALSNRRGWSVLRD
jgi:hypothetical protein